MDSSAPVGVQESARQLVSVMTLERAADDELIYYTISPDYCLPDMSLGSLGTKERLAYTSIVTLSYIFMRFSEYYKKQ